MFYDGLYVFNNEFELEKSGLSDTLLSSTPQTKTADPTVANTGIVVLFTSVDIVVLAIASVAAVMVVVRVAAAVTVVVVVVLVDILFFLLLFYVFIWCCCVCVFGCVDGRGLVAVAATLAIVAGVLVKEGSVAVVILAVAVMVVDLTKIYNL